MDARTHALMHSSTHPLTHSPMHARSHSLTTRPPPPHSQATKNQCFPIPTTVHAFNNVTIRSIATGAAHTAAITTDGRVFTWGKCHQGQSGHGARWGPTADCCVDWPRIVVGPLATLRVTFVAAGVSHVIAGTMTGRTFTWGAGEWGQLGHGDAKGR